MMEPRLHAQMKAAPPPSFAPVHRGMLQRKCACGGSSGVTDECEDCDKQKLSLQRSTADSERATPNSKLETRNPAGVLPIVHEVLRSPGQPLDQETRAFMEPRFGHDFSQVRVHTGAKAAESAQAVNAFAYTVGHNVVFGAGQYTPQAATGRRVLAHELTHVVQQEGTVRGLAAESQLSPATHRVTPLGEGGHELTIAPAFDSEGDVHEREADAVAERVNRLGEEPTGATITRHLIDRKISRKSVSLQRMELPTPLPICGAMVTHIDVLPARPRPLTECGLPATLMVTRINIVGRQVSSRSTGRGRIIFNLHIGYYRDPASGRLCAVISDSTGCLTPGGCIRLGCFPTLREVLDAIWEAVKTLLRVLGIIILAIIFVLLLRGLRTAPGEAPGFQPAPVMASNSREETSTGEGETAEA